MAKGVEVRGGVDGGFLEAERGTFRMLDHRPSHSEVRRQMANKDGTAEEEELEGEGSGGSDWSGVGAGAGDEGGGFGAVCGCKTQARPLVQHQSGSATVGGAATVASAATVCPGMLSQVRKLVRVKRRRGMCCACVLRLVRALWPRLLEGFVIAACTLFVLSRPEGSVGVIVQIALGVSRHAIARLPCSCRVPMLARAP
jgi:hypothetical protein